MAGTLESTQEVELFVSKETFDVDDDDDALSWDRKLEEVSRSCEPLSMYSCP